MAIKLKPDLLPNALSAVATIRPAADWTFFACISVILGVTFLGVFVAVRFDWWEVRENELLHHHGILSDLERHSTLHLKIDKEINDVFEYLLLRSGRLILQPTTSRRAIVLDNIPLISQKEQQITQLLNALSVQVAQDDEVPG